MKITGIQKENRVCLTTIVNHYRYREHIILNHFDQSLGAEVENWSDHHGPADGYTGKELVCSLSTAASHWGYREETDVNITASSWGYRKRSGSVSTF